MKPIWTFLAAAIVLASSPSIADPPRTAALTIRVSNLRSNNGQVDCTIYNSAKGFPTDSSAALQRRWCPPANAASTCGFGPKPARSLPGALLPRGNNTREGGRGGFLLPAQG